MHLWLATSAVRRFGFRGEYDDLLQVARSGLVEAFDRYDPAQTSYAYFAWVTMNGLLRRHLRDHGWSIRPPRPLQEAANLLRRETPELTQRLGRTPTVGRPGRAPELVGAGRPRRPRCPARDEQRQPGRVDRRQPDR